MKRLSALVLALLLSPLCAQAQNTGFTTDFRIGDCDFSNTGRNPYWSLQPGDQSLLVGDDDGEEAVVEITVLDETRRIRFTTPDGERMRVRARVIREREWKDDELVEISHNYYARCRQTNSIFYFGEEVDIYEDGEVVANDGAWLAGRDGAQPGVIMPGMYLLGARYFQEVAPGIALDRAEHTAMDLTLSPPLGTYEDCVEIIETTPLEPGSTSLKRYCPEVGLVRDGPIELVAYSSSGDEDDEDDDEDDDD